MGSEMCIRDSYDTGSGMDDRELSGFRERGGKSASSEGSGLGLAISFELSRVNGMNLSVQSEVGKGSVFRLDALCAS